MATESSNPRAVRAWLLAMCILILCMIGVGGVTRLTQSGLSMVTWEPVMGAIPPLSEADWQHRFEQYQQFPEYRQLNRHMELPEFKRIFFWEYIHRLLGRFLGVAFLVPFVYFLVRRRVQGALAVRLGVAFVLGGLQGVLGWYMVKSGLVDDPRVSHFRLAAHLGLALLLLGYQWWIWLGLGHRPEKAQHPRLRGWTLAFLALLILQVVYGAFVAGLDAGLFLNTWPKMGSDWIASAAFNIEPLWRDLLYNAITIQFIHRTLGVAVGLLALGLWIAAWRLSSDSPVYQMVSTVFGLTMVQFALGVATLLQQVPVVLGVSHQVNAALLLLAALALLHRLVRAAPDRRT